MTQVELQAAVDAFKWYHEIDVGQGVKTKPKDRYDKSWDLIEHGMNDIDVAGKQVLDVGTRDGKYAFLAEIGGAEVTAIDNDLSQGALWLKRHFESKVDFIAQNLFDVPRAWGFDVVFLFGVLYHLRYPMQGLRHITSLLNPGGKLYIESGIFTMHEEMPLLYCPVRKSPYEQTSCSFFNLSGLRETLWSFGCNVTSHLLHASEDGNLVRRAWIESEKTHDMPDDLQKYWEGTHTSHD